MVPPRTPLQVMPAVVGNERRDLERAYTYSAVETRIAHPYAGDTVVHCHTLHHEDRGMMLVTKIQGDEGTLWAGAEQVDVRRSMPRQYSIVAVKEQ